MRRPCKWKVMLQKNEYWINVEFASDGAVRFVVAVEQWEMVDACFSSLARRRSTPRTDPCQRKYTYIYVYVLRLPTSNTKPPPPLSNSVPNPPNFCVIASTLHTYRMLAAFLFFSFFLISRSDLLRPKLIFPLVEKKDSTRMDINVNYL